jgi:hypothetical protein
VVDAPAVCLIASPWTRSFNSSKSGFSAGVLINLEKALACVHWRDKARKGDSIVCVMNRFRSGHRGNEVILTGPEIAVCDP